MYSIGFLFVLVRGIGGNMSVPSSWKWKSPMHLPFKAFQGLLGKDKDPCSSDLKW